MPLSDIALRTLKPRERAYKVYDRNGLFLLVSPAGSKLWRWRYRFDLKEKLMALGEYPVTSLALARERQFSARKTLSSGVDPMAERKAEAEAKQKEAEAREREAESSFEKVARRDVAKRAHETTGQVFRYAIAHGIASRNPAADFKPKDILADAKSENFARVDAKELPDLLLNMENYDGDALTRLAMRLMAYTFVRTSELIEAEWSEFDLDSSRWDIPAERMKMDSPHIVPLSRQSIAVVRALSLLTGNRRLVFPGANDKEKPMSNNTILFALYRLGYKGRMTGHGFRGLASTILHENGFEDEHVELQLAHQRRNQVAAAYNHAKYLKQRKAMIQWWADYLDARLAKGRQSINGLCTDRSAIPAEHNRKKSPSRIKQPIATRAHALRPTV